MQISSRSFVSFLPAQLAPARQPDPVRVPAPVVREQVDAPVHNGGTTAPNRNSIERGVTENRLRDFYTTELKTKMTAAGVGPAEQAQVLAQLQKVQGGDFVREAAMLNTAFATPNAARAVKTYLDLAPMRAQRPDRITPEVVQSLTMAVAWPRGTEKNATEGVMGHDAALKAAKALTVMSPADYKNTIDLMKVTGNDTNPQASAETERALILKAVSARASRYENPLPQDLVARQLGVTTGAQLEVSAFAAGIRGMSRDELIRKTSTIDLNNDNKNDALKQRFVNSCAPAVVQIARAEADPAYALFLNQEKISGVDTNSIIGAEQAAMLAANGIAPVTNGANHSGIELSKVLGAASPASNQSYQHTAVGDDAASRRAALDKIDQALQRGQDVPVSANIDGFGDHAVIFTDVRKTAEGREFLFTDPFSGRSDWVKEADLMKGNGDLGSGNGKITGYYV